MDNLLNRIEQLTPRQRRHLADLLGTETAASSPNDDAVAKQLIAYIIPASDNEISPKELREYLRDYLPEYMIPTAYVSLSKFPLTPNGKIDRQALPDPEPDWEAADYEFAGPRNPIETELVNIWSQALGIDLISINDNFFDLGGHSLLVTQIISQIRARYGVDIPVRVFYNASTVIELAERIQIARWAVEDEVQEEPPEDYEEIVL
jgi:acyl carrier protein